MKSFRNAAKYAEWKAENDFYAVIGDPAGDKSYPTVAATFILAADENMKANKKTAAFFDWAFANGDKTAEDLGYVPLPVETKKMIRRYWIDAGMR
jgi:phosphate transport system substrate-binding protein